jgi:hypothetical protein
MRLDELFMPDPRYTRGYGRNNVLMLTSLSYLLTMLAALHGNDMFAATASGNLAVTSFIYHMTKDIHYFWVDQAAVYLYAVATIHAALFKGTTFHKAIVAGTVLYSIFVYHVGYAYTCYIWDPDCHIATSHHAAMHFIPALAGLLTFLIE